MEKVNFKIMIDPFSIMVINQKGYLRKLYCPFRVLCIESLDSIPRNTWCFVDKVAADSKEIILYGINGKQFPYRYFQIYISF